MASVNGTCGLMHNTENLFLCACFWQISYLVMFVYIAFTLGDWNPSVAPFYVTSKVQILLDVFFAISFGA